MSGKSDSPLDQLVKGAAPTSTTTDKVVQQVEASNDDSLGTKNLADTSSTASNEKNVDTAPPAHSSPPQIYLNLLILEAGLRAQYLALRARRRQNLFFVSLLSIWVLGFTWLLFLAPRSDGKGLGGSAYWVVETVEKLCLMAGVITCILVWGTGQWERGVRWPRRFVTVANRGLRTMNCKLVVIKGPWWREVLSHLAFIFPYSSLFPDYTSKYHLIDTSIEKKSHHISTHHHYHTETREEDLSPGGDYIKLLLLAKPFSSEFREDWELYRNEYWERENERRAVLLQKLTARERARLKAERGWLWWIGVRWHKRKPSDLEKSTHSHTHAHSHTHSRRESRTLTDKEVKRLSVRGSISGASSLSHSRSGSVSKEDESRPPSRSEKEGRRRSQRVSIASDKALQGLSAGSRRSVVASSPLSKT